MEDSPSDVDEFTPLALSPNPAKKDVAEEIEVLNVGRSPLKDMLSGTINLVNTIIGGGMLGKSRVHWDV